MKELPRSANFKLLSLIKKLKKDSEFINNNEFISVLNALKSISNNQKFVDNLMKSIKVLEQTDVHRKGHLSKREKEVLLHIGEGLKNKDIAKELDLSKSTVETHRKNIRKKLQLSGKDNLFSIALLFSLQYNSATQDNLF